MSFRGTGKDGYRDGEVPVYSHCLGCGEEIRVDRRDLVLEHKAVCAASSQITPFQLRVLELVADGETNPVIARKLHVSLETILYQLRVIFLLLDASTRAHAVAQGFRRGLIS